MLGAVFQSADTAPACAQALKSEGKFVWACKNYGAGSLRTARPSPAPAAVLLL